MPLKGTKKYINEEITVNIEKHNIEKVTFFKYLGIIIDFKLNWNEHIKNLTKKIHKFVPIFYNMRYYTTQKVSLQLLKTMIINTINYGIEIYGNAKITYLQKLLNKMMGILCFTNDYDKINRIKIDNNILDIEKYYKFAWIKITHDIIYNSRFLPQYYKKLIEIKQNRNGIVIETKYRKSKYGDKISHNIMESYWNKIDKNFRDIQDKNLFMNSILSNFKKEKN